MKFTAGQHPYREGLMREQVRGLPEGWDARTKKLCISVTSGKRQGWLCTDEMQPETPCFFLTLSCLQQRNHVQWLLHPPLSPMSTVITAALVPGHPSSLNLGKHCNCQLNLVGRKLRETTSYNSYHCVFRTVHYHVNVQIRGITEKCASAFKFHLS